MGVKNMKKEDGMVIVEATIIFPIMFLIIFLMIFLGNAFFHKSSIDSIATQMAHSGAAQCADPLLRVITEKGKVPSLKEANYKIEPYRYLLGEVGKNSGMNTIETNVKKQINTRLKNLKSGMFSNMKPSSTKVVAEFNNAFIYSTFEVEIQYKIPIPIRLIGMKNFFNMYASSRCEVPVSDTPEFVRNVNMVADWVESSETGQKAIEEAEKIMGKVSEFIN